jgi:uncharacterized membrane protein
MILYNREMAIEIPDATKKFLIAAVLLIIADIPWLTFMGSANNAVITDIQGGKVPYFRLSAAVPVYIALAYLVLQVKDKTNAFLTGLSVYAVYDFTVYLAFKNYPLWLALADGLWGGVLFTIVYSLLKYLK